MPPPTEGVAHFMARALALAARGRGRTAPNPMVGCVIVRAGHVVGEGWHRRAGEAHAEVVALADAGERARGADVYVTLEPCHHTGRTGPCTAALRAAGVRRVFVAEGDPDVRVAGRGLRHLRRAGLQVHCGLLAAEARRLNAAYHRVKTTGLPYLVAKVAQSLDGCVATRTGASRWITGPSARAAGHRLRDRVDAILVGRGTVLADDPALTCRLPGGRDPVRVVLASRAQLPLQARVLHGLRSGSAQPGGQVGPASPTAPIVVVGPQAPAARCRALAVSGARLVHVPAGPGGVDLVEALASLARLGLHSVLAEGGPTLLGGLFDAGLVQRLYAFVAPKVIGGPARHSVGGLGVSLPDAAARLRRGRWTQVGEDWLLRADVVGQRGQTPGTWRRQAPRTSKLARGARTVRAEAPGGV